MVFPQGPIWVVCEYPRGFLINIFTELKFVTVGVLFVVMFVRVVSGYEASGDGRVVWTLTPTTFAHTKKHPQPHWQDQFWPKPYQTDPKSYNKTPSSGGYSWTQTAACCIQFVHIVTKSKNEYSS